MNWKDLKVGDRVFRAETVMLPKGDVVRVVEYEVKLIGKRLFEFLRVDGSWRLRYAYTSYGSVVKEPGRTAEEALDVLDESLSKQIEDAERRFNRQKKEIRDRQQLVAEC